MYYFDRCKTWSTSLTLSTRHNMSELEAGNPSATLNSLERGNEASPNELRAVSKHGEAQNELNQQVRIRNPNTNTQLAASQEQDSRRAQSGAATKRGPLREESAKIQQERQVTHEAKKREEEARGALK